MERERIVASMKNSEFRRLDQKKVSEIKNNFTGPLIAVIGAASPGYEYVPQLGIVAGYELRKLCKDKGYLFSGGVEGIGADVFTGACIYATQNKFPSKFFVVIPDNYTILDDSHNDLVVPYDISNTYKAIERITDTECEIVRAGYEMSERRLYLSAIADVVIVINGGSGTFDEAKIALEFGKTVIALQSSGGAAEALCQWKMGYKPKAVDVKYRLKPFMETLSTKPSPEIANKIIIAKNVPEMIGSLRTFIKTKL